MDIEFISEQEVEKIMRDVIDLFLIPRFMSLGMNATGQWRDNLEARGNTIWGREYTESLVYGSPPKTVVAIEPLIKWAQAKFGYSGNRAISVAFAVKKKIYREGTEYYKEGGTTLLEVLNEKKTLDYVTNEAAKIITNKMMIKINRKLSNFKTI